METKIIFNGKTYTKVEDMPEEVRQAYQQALAQFLPTPIGTGFPIS